MVKRLGEYTLIIVFCTVLLALAFTFTLTKVYFGGKRSEASWVELTMRRGGRRLKTFLKNMGTILDSFLVIFVLLSSHFVLGDRTWGRWMVGTDESVELWRLPSFWPHFVYEIKNKHLFCKNDRAYLQLLVWIGLFNDLVIKEIWKRPNLFFMIKLTHHSGLSNE